MTRHVSVSIMFASGRPSQQPASKVHAGVCWPRGADADSLIPPSSIALVDGASQSTEILPGRLRQAWCIADKPRLVTLTCLVFRGTITTKSPVTTDVQLIIQLREFRFCPRSDVSLPPTYLLELLLLSHKHSAIMRRILGTAMPSTLCLTFSLRQRQRRELKDMYHCPRFRARGDYISILFFLLLVSARLRLSKAPELHAH